MGKKKGGEMGSFSKFVMLGLIIFIFIVLYYLSQMTDWDEYTPYGDCPDFSSWFLYNQNTLEFQVFRLIFIIVLSFSVSILTKKFNL